MSATRRQRRRKGQRQQIRECKNAVVRIIELSDKDFSLPVIAATVGIGEDLVADILQRAGEVRADVSYTPPPRSDAARPGRAAAP